MKMKKDFPKINAIEKDYDAIPLNNPAEMKESEQRKKKRKKELELIKEEDEKKLS